MTEFYQAVPFLLPAWFLSMLAFLAAAECIGLSLYLMRTDDHLSLHGADLGLIGVFSILGGVQYLLIQFSPDLVRGIAISRIVFFLFFGANVVIMARYIYEILHRNRQPDA